MLLLDMNTFSVLLQTWEFLECASFQELLLLRGSIFLFCSKKDESGVFKPRILLTISMQIVSLCIVLSSAYGSTSPNSSLRIMLPSLSSITSTTFSKVALVMSGSIWSGQPAWSDVTVTERVAVAVICPLCGVIVCTGPVKSSIVKSWPGGLLLPPLLSHSVVRSTLSLPPWRHQLVRFLNQQPWMMCWWWLCLCLSLSCLGPSDLWQCGFCANATGTTGNSAAMRSPANAVVVLLLVFVPNGLVLCIAPHEECNASNWWGARKRS